MSKIAIIIPNWNGAEKLQKHLPDVLAAAEFASVSEVIVVDDGSGDESVSLLKNKFPQVRLIEKDKNTGFSSTVNLGVSSTNAEYVVLLNSDASPKKDFLVNLLPHFKDPKVFSVGSNTGGSYARAEFKNGFFWHSQVVEKPSQAHQTLWVSGGSGIFRKSIWDELRGMDTLFDPFYEEDLDLGYRAWKRGYINIFEPKSIVEHYHEKGVIAINFSPETINRIAQRNQLIFIWKNITSERLFRSHKIALIKKLILHPRYWLVFLSALTKVSQIKLKREQEKKSSKLTDEEILANFKL
ncbi:MAG: glycosyltransferase family 2 protein [Candidatus Daviesbacteria bacterium]|nr:glycosyltransferase family 2 protein [Candidatus Daviesbacteria bacterium]